MYRRFFKRFFDIIISFSALVILSPLFLLMIITVSIGMKGNPFFVQRRPGKNCKFFKLLKFRTMNNAKDADGNLLPNNKRYTKFGNFLRKTSLDELPQLINIFVGDMSLIGPRPLIKEQIDCADEFEINRQLIRPGITGFAQINGRNAIGLQVKFAYDLIYLQNCSFWTDVKIFFKTIKNVIIRQDYEQENLESITNEKKAYASIEKISAQRPSTSYNPIKVTTIVAENLIPNVDSYDNKEYTIEIDYEQQNAVAV